MHERRSSGGRQRSGRWQMVVAVGALLCAMWAHETRMTVTAQSLDFTPFINQWRHEEFVLNVDASGRAVAVWPAACPDGSPGCRVYADLTLLTAAANTAFGTVASVQDQDGRPYSEPVFAPGARVMLVVMSFDMAVLLVDRQSVVLCGVSHRTAAPGWLPAWWGGGSPCTEAGGPG